MPQEMGAMGWVRSPWKLLDGIGRKIAVIKNHGPRDSSIVDQRSPGGPGDDQRKPSGFSGMPWIEPRKQSFRVRLCRKHWESGQGGNVWALSQEWDPKRDRKVKVCEDMEGSSWQKGPGRTLVRAHWGSFLSTSGPILLRVAQGAEGPAYQL